MKILTPKQKEAAFAKRFSRLWHSRVVVLIILFDREIFSVHKSSVTLFVIIMFDEARKRFRVVRVGYSEEFDAFCMLQMFPVLHHQRNPITRSKLAAIIFLSMPRPQAV